MIFNKGSAGLANKLPRSKLRGILASSKSFFLAPSSIQQAGRFRRREMKNLKGFIDIFDKELLSYLDNKIKQFVAIDARTAILVKEIKELILAGGKRLRPAFCYFGYLASGGQDKRTALKVSLALELGQAFALIHDDIIDNSSLRRGQPTVFKKLGLPSAILVGDLACTLADEIFTGLSLSEKTILQAKHYFDLLKEEVIAGQYLDVLGAKTEKEILKILEYKTGRYTVVRPLQIGAALALAPDQIFKVFENHGVPLGIAFQIKDDILGMFGNEKIIGKPVDSDLREGKRTLLIIKTLEKSGKDQTKKLMNLLGNQKIGRTELDWVRKLIVETGSLDYCQNLAQQLINQAKSAISDYPFEKEGKKFLLETADFVLQRKF